jgi:hypothetical protein
MLEHFQMEGRMRRTLVAVLSLLMSPHHLAAQTLDKQFQAREETILKDIKAKQYDKFRDVLDPEFSSVYASGVQGRGPEVDAAKKVNVRSYDLSDVKARQLDPSIVL